MFRKITSMVTRKYITIRQGYEADSLEVELTIFGSRGSMLGSIRLDQNDLRQLREVILSLELQPAGCTCSSVIINRHYPTCELWGSKVQGASASGSAPEGDEFLGSTGSDLQG